MTNLEAGSSLETAVLAEKVVGSMGHRDLYEGVKVGRFEQGYRPDKSWRQMLLGYFLGVFAEKSGDFGLFNFPLGDFQNQFLVLGFF
jgi:hypothetical protein